MNNLSCTQSDNPEVRMLAILANVGSSDGYSVVNGIVEGIQKSTAGGQQLEGYQEYISSPSFLLWRQLTGYKEMRVLKLKLAILFK